MSSACYLMAADLGDLAYAIAILIMAGASAAVSYYKKKKKQAQFEEDITRRSQRAPQAEARPPARRLEEWIEVLLPEEMKPARRPPAPRPGLRGGERPGVGPSVAPARPAAPPHVESPLRPTRRPAPPRPRPARPAAPPPPKPAEPSSAERTHEATVELAVPVGPAGRPSYLPTVYSSAELRKAIIMSEILGKPVALRDEAGY